LGTGFKAPSLSELYQNFPAFDFFANPNLQAEQSTGYDVGFEQPFLNDRIRVGSTYFHNNIINLIDDNATFTSLCQHRQGADLRSRVLRLVQG
jgi:vitamin B12 transporter